jgi:hypothetical protein
MDSGREDPPTLPQEVIDLILDLTDKKILKVCSRVARLVSVNETTITVLTSFGLGHFGTPAKSTFFPISHLDHRRNSG